MKKILITGGAGFIGSHLTDKLIESGYSVKVLDNLTQQVHGKDGNIPDYLNSQAELIIGDVRNESVVNTALKEIDVVFHFAALVGVGQSMYQIKEYTDVNICGTANLLQQIIKNPIKKLIVASSMSIYGEGLYKDSNGNIATDSERSLQQLRKGEWELKDETEQSLSPFATPEWKKPFLNSIYALSKYNQEQMCLITGKAYKIRTTALRFFNVYGTRQALSNPYTGVLAIFASRLLNNNPPLIFEDGRQRRDFVSVHDIVQACMLSMEKEEADYQSFNIGSGKSFSVLQIADQLAMVLKKQNIRPEIAGKYRVGDIRHCFADITKARVKLGYEPKVSLEEGLNELSEWLKEQKAEDKVLDARNELAARGLTI